MTTTTPKSATPADPWTLVCHMEQPLQVLTDLARFLHLISIADGQFEQPDALALQRLAALVDEYTEEASELRGELFRLLHPDRAKFEREGWPGDAPPDDEKRAAPTQ